MIIKKIGIFGISTISVEISVRVYYIVLMSEEEKDKKKEINKKNVGCLCIKLDKLIDRK